MPPPYFSDHGLREVMGTTYTPSDLRYAKEVIPRITQRTDGGRAFPSAMKNFCKRTRFFAASSIILAPNFISNAPHLPSENSIDPSFSTPFRTLHAYSSKRIQHEFQTCIGDTWHKSKRTPPTARKNEGVYFTQPNVVSHLDPHEQTWARCLFYRHRANKDI